MPDYHQVAENFDNRDPISHREPAIVPRLSPPYSCSLPCGRPAQILDLLFPPCCRCTRDPADCVLGVSYSIEAWLRGKERTIFSKVERVRQNGEM